MFNKLCEKLIRRRAENATMRLCHVSRAYVQEVIANMEDFLAGRITEAQWQAQATHIAFRYPQDSLNAARIFGKAEGKE